MYLKKVNTRLRRGILQVYPSWTQENFRGKKMKLNSLEWWSDCRSNHHEKTNKKQCSRPTLAWACCSSCSSLSLSIFSILLVSWRVPIVSIFFSCSCCWARVLVVAWVWEKGGKCISLNKMFFVLLFVFF